ncbi:hypothetical protein WA026_006865 [Henosepilachna vigintioctopunctata]|uniref:(S)-2-hydroxy-acid oxidase n=1 Tax=Henosepilachna vigintioctopunctata TaxID=420089 RepID=A0AAW1U868_9CUCU
MSGKLVCVDDYEKYAASVLPKNTLEFYKGGAGEETTLIDNKRAFLRYKLRPRFLRDVSKRDLSTAVLEEKISFPVGISPVAMQKLASPEGEQASVRAAESVNTIFILSTAANSSIEEVAKAAPKCIKWFQLYIFKDRSVTKNLIQRAEKAGFKAIVVTIDTPVFGLRRANMRNQLISSKDPPYKNFDDQGMNTIDDKAGGLAAYVNKLFDDSLKWEDIAWLKTITTLPIILKGVMTAEDAILSVHAKVDGILVSNHGARQLDGTFATIDVLEEIVKAVDNKIEVYLDGGIRDGTDVFKALALGAKMVFMGRPALWGLVHDGEEGVKKVLNIVKHELDTALALCGCCDIGDIRRDMVAKQCCQSKL